MINLKKAPRPGVGAGGRPLVRYHIWWDFRDTSIKARNLGNLESFLSGKWAFNAD